MADTPTDRDVDPGLAAFGELYGLLIAAKRRPGERVSRSFPASLAYELVERARHCGFVVDAGSHNTAPDELVTVTVKWPADEGAKR